MDLITFLLQSKMITRDQYDDVKKIQKSQTPDLIDIAVLEDMLSPLQINLLSKLSVDENLAPERIAMNMRFLDEQQVGALKKKQKKRRPAIRSILLNERILDEDVLARSELEYNETYGLNRSSELSHQNSNTLSGSEIFTAKVGHSFKTDIGVPIAYDKEVTLEELRGEQSISMFVILQLEYTEVELGICADPDLCIEIANYILSEYKDVDESLIVDSIAEYLSLLMSYLIEEDFFGANMTMVFSPRRRELDTLEKSFRVSQMRTNDNFKLWVFYREEKQETAINM